MRTLLLLFTFSASLSVFAQPVLENYDKRVGIGTTAALYSGTASGPGTSGANQSWDYSATVFTNTGLVWTVVDPKSTPFNSSYPTANYGWEFAQGSTKRYFYFQYSPTKYEVIADNITTPGTGNDYSPNPEQTLKFPFKYGDTFQDSYQKVGQSPGSVTMTYDSYGTLKTPYGTYTNVIRLKEDKGGNLVTYNWVGSNPIQTLMVYNVSNGSLTLFGKTNVGIDTYSLENAIQLYPNPAKDHFSINLPESISDCTIKLYNMLGAMVMETKLTSGFNTVSASTLKSGIYIYQISGSGELHKCGKLIVEY